MDRLDPLVAEEQRCAQRNCGERGLKVLRTQQGSTTGLRKPKQILARCFACSFPKRRRRSVGSGKLEPHPRMLGSLPRDEPRDHAVIPPSTAIVCPVM